MSDAYTRLPVPPDGFQDGKDSFKITDMEICAGERTPDCTVVHVRGTFSIRRDTSYHFAGLVVIREGRDYPVQDLRIFGMKLSRAEGLVSSLAIDVCLALDALAEGFMIEEMSRICG